MSNQQSFSAPTLLEFPNHRPIDRYSFRIPGLGNAGPNCGADRVDAFSSDGASARYSPLRCKRIECPTCWPDWAKRMVFDLAVKIEGYARSTGTRPYSVLMSVPPAEVVDEEWDWERVNTSLFRRGYRRLSKVGIDGGNAVFHPYRIKKVWKDEFRATGIHNDVGMWQVIRERVQGGASLYEFVDLGPHVHGIVFGKPEEHTGSDFLIQFNDEGSPGVPKELSLSDIVGFLFYLITHTGVLKHITGYKKHHGKDDEVKVRKRVTHPIRSFGCLFRVRAEDLLSVDAYNELATEVAGKVGMRWSDAGTLEYPASCKELGTGDEGVVWVPIHQLSGFIGDIEWFSRLSGTQMRFWLEVERFMVDRGRPPDPGEVVAPVDITVFVSDDSDKDPSLTEPILIPSPAAVSVLGIP